MTDGRVDAHLHLWDLDRVAYDWLGPETGALFRSYRPAEASAALQGSGFARAVLVQAANSPEDTDFMLAVADENAWVAGVVAWTALDDPRAVDLDLSGRLAHPAVKGVRHLIHEDPRGGAFLDDRAVRRSLGEIAAAGLALEIPDAWPAILEHATAVAKAIPELLVVLDHLGKPPVGRAELAEWGRSVERFGALPNTAAKLSGLRGADGPFPAAALRPVWELALSVFGPERLMYGGDWPMTVPTGGYAAALRPILELVAELSRDERDAVLRGTAERVLHL